MSSETVRINPQTHTQLKELSDQSGEPMTVLVADAVDLLFRQRFLEQCNQAYARLKADPKAWNAELEERAAWDDALTDGLQE
ncbi:MAG: toxin-antitoxin system protein [Planctomycetaceae bacterium]